MPVGGVAGEEDPSDAVPVGQHRFEDPVADAVHGRLEVGQVQQFPHAGDDGRFVEALRVVGSEGEVQHPLF